MSSGSPSRSMPSSIPSQTSTPTSTPSSFNRFILIPLGLCVFVIIGIIIVVYSGVFKNKDSTNNNDEFSTDNPMSKGGYFYFD
jgi:hypothetical protein